MKIRSSMWKKKQIVRKRARTKIPLDPVPFSRARGKLGVDLFKVSSLSVSLTSDHYSFVRRSNLSHLCMFIQGQHIDTVNVVIWHCFQFNLFLTFDPLSVGRTKRSQWTLLHLRPRLTHWPLYFCHLTHFVIWPFFDLWPLNCRSDKEVTVDTFASLSKTNTLTLLLLSFDTFCNLTFLWPLTPSL